MQFLIITTIVSSVVGLIVYWDNRNIRRIRAMNRERLYRMGYDFVMADYHDSITLKVIGKRLEGAAIKGEMDSDFHRGASEALMELVAREKTDG